VYYVTEIQEPVIEEEVTEEEEKVIEEQEIEEEEEVEVEPEIESTFDSGIEVTEPDIDIDEEVIAEKPAPTVRMESISGGGALKLSFD
jgi:hypothetical protein